MKKSFLKTWKHLMEFLLYEDVKGYIRKLRALMLSNGNDRIPHYKTCKENCNDKLTREKYKKIYDRYKDDEDADATVYFSLDINSFS